MPPKGFAVEDAGYQEPTKIGASKIKINQTNTDNKDNSINGLVFVLSDEKSVDRLVSVLKNNFDKK